MWMGGGADRFVVEVTDGFLLCELRGVILLVWPLLEVGEEVRVLVYS